MSTEARPPEPPLTLNELTTIGGLAPDKAYGADHAPRFDQDDANRLYLEAGETLRALSAKLNGLQLLAVLAGLEHISGRGEPPHRVGIAMVELAQALILQSPLPGDDIDQRNANGFIDALWTDFHLFLDQTAKPAVDEKGQILSRRRIQTLMVRHTDYTHHASDIFRRIGEHLKTVGHARFGMSLGDASFVSMGAAYFVGTMIGGSRVPAEIQRWLETGEAAFDPAWIDLFEVVPELLHSAIPDIPVERIRQLLDRLSIEPGALAATDPAHLHLANPVWRKPFVKDGGRWFCFSPGTLFSSQPDVLNELAGDISSEPVQLVGKARGDALEDLVAEPLESMFPHGRLLRSVMWNDASGKEYETDAILLIDGIALIFESKGDVLSLTGRRGSNTWFKEFDDIVVKASLQAWRLEKALRDPSRSTFELRSASGVVTIQKGEIRHVVRFGASLERVTMASYGVEGELRKRIDRAGGKSMPIFTVGDLWQVRDLIASEGERLHFILRRAELEQDFEFVADELDLIAHYLRTGFVRMFSRQDRRIVSLYGLSDFLRPYQKGTPNYQADVEFPQRVTAWWAEIIRKLEADQRPLWTDRVYDLLNVPLASQQRFENDIALLRDKMRGMSMRAREGVLMQEPEHLRPSAFACIVMCPMSPAERIAAARVHFRELDEAHSDERLFVFVLDSQAEDTRPALPYYRGVPWDRVIGKIDAVGESVASELYVEIDPAPPAPRE